jgi:hypothetical protein
MVNFNALLPGCTNENLLAYIGPWAKEHHPEKYEATLKQVAKPSTFRNYLLRLIEIRAAEEPGWFTTLPVSVLDETAIKRTLTIKSTGQTYIVAGKKYVPPPGERTPDMTWTMLDAPPEDFRQLADAITTLDLEVVR